MTVRRWAGIAAGVAALLCLRGVWADPAPEKVNGADRAFLLKAAMGSLAEVKLGQLAVERAASERVRKLGKRMIDDHSKATAELRGLAKERGMVLPLDIDAEHKAVYGRLAALTGAAFDRAYLAALVEVHRKDITEFEKQASDGEDVTLKAWASRMLPELRLHLKMARDLEGPPVGDSK